MPHARWDGSGVVSKFFLGRAVRWSLLSTTSNHCRHFCPHPTSQGWTMVLSWAPMSISWCYCLAPHSSRVNRQWLSQDKIKLQGFGFWRVLWTSLFLEELYASPAETGFGAMCVLEAVSWYCTLQQQPRGVIPLQTFLALKNIWDLPTISHEVCTHEVDGVSAFC